MTTAVTSKPGFGNRIAQLYAQATDAAGRYAAYRRTYAELNALHIDALLDLDLYRGDLKQVAHKAVYGH